MAVPVSMLVRGLVGAALRDGSGDGVQLSVEIKEYAQLDQYLRRLAGRAARESYAKALNDTGFEVRRRMQRHLGERFDRVTPWVQRSPKVFQATPDKLSVAVAPTITTDHSVFMRGGKVGVDPQDVLQAQEYGGRRRDKRSEVALRRAGILPSGYQTAIPATPYPGSDDGRGNLRGAFLQQLLSYLQAFSEQGYRANMTDRRKRSVHKGTARQAGRRYFVSYGRLRGGPGQHLAAGIWAASGTGGVDVRPVLMFVRAPTYRPRLQLQRMTSEADLQAYLDRRVRFRIREAAGV